MSAAIGMKFHIGNVAVCRARRETNSYRYRLSKLASTLTGDLTNASCASGVSGALAVPHDVEHEIKERMDD